MEDNYKKQISELNSKLSDERRLKDRAKQQYYDSIDRHNKDLKELTHLIFKLEGKNREFISALEKIRMMSINASVESNRQIRELITVTLLEPIQNN